MPKRSFKDSAINLIFYVFIYFVVVAFMAEIIKCIAEIKVSNIKSLHFMIQPR